ncbi:MAG: DNA-binding protein [Gemmataceae bacterium]|jgi:predicted transcriptional regulator|nr:DNA-binding protein [Gemmataceae bacterium]
MTAITIILSEERLQKLQELAKLFQVSPEELVRFSVEELLSRPDKEFQKALDYVLQKNSELYQRLA